MPRGPTRAQQALKDASPALKFVLMVGIMSFFADFTYQGARSIAAEMLAVCGGGLVERGHDVTQRRFPFGQFPPLLLRLGRGRFA
jgi:hypothetical protein